MIVILLGVSGSGKTTIGQLLAESLGWPYFDADEFHPATNIDKMSRGISLTDEDRWPWLGAIRAKIELLMQTDDSGVFSCSGLKLIYREQLKQSSEPVEFVYLKGDFALIESRMKDRQHFMRPDMLASQFATLEEPGDALIVDIAQTPEQCVQQIRDGLRI